MFNKKGIFFFTRPFFKLTPLRTGSRKDESKQMFTSRFPRSRTAYMSFNGDGEGEGRVCACSLIPFFLGSSCIAETIATYNKF